jgi:hypothetical protein
LRDRVAKTGDHARFGGGIDQQQRRARTQQGDEILVDGHGARGPGQWGVEDAFW